MKFICMCGGLVASNGNSWWPLVGVGGRSEVSRVFGKSFERERERERGEKLCFPP